MCAAVAVSFGDSSPFINVDVNNCLSEMKLLSITYADRSRQVGRTVCSWEVNLQFIPEPLFTLQIKH